MTILFNLLWCLILSEVKIQKARQMFSSVLPYERQNVKYSFAGSFLGCAWFGVNWFATGSCYKIRCPLGLRFELLTIEKWALCVFFTCGVICRDLKSQADFRHPHTWRLRTLERLRRTNAGPDHGGDTESVSVFFFLSSRQNRGWPAAPSRFFLFQSPL